MSNAFDRFSLRRITGSVAAAITVFILLAPSASAQVLVGNPFDIDHQGWIDPDPARGGQWRLSLHNPTMMETANTTPPAPGAPDIATPHSGNYYPMLMVQDDYTTPSTYDYNVRMYTNDDDLWGVVFGYQDPDNYYRVGFRSQTGGNLGATSGVSVQKVSGGVISQISPNGPGTIHTDFPTFATSDNRTPVDITVSVTGTNYSVSVAAENGGNALFSGSDPGLTAGKIGVQSWAQLNRATIDPFWGTEVESVSVTQGASTLFQDSFDYSPVEWRPLAMANSEGLRTNASDNGSDRGNFGVDLDSPWIYQQSNGFRYATATAPNIDFIGPAVVVDEPGATAYGDYETRVRLAARDNDGIGVIVRAQDDNNFYRISFTNEATGTNPLQSRARQGMSVQKVRNGVWSELYSDDFAPLFVHTVPGEGSGQTPTTGLQNHWFDLSVTAVDNTLQVQVIDNDGNTIDYPLITDFSDPILAGSAGLTTWGNVHSYFMPYAGVDTPFITAINPALELSLTVNRDNGNLLLTNAGTGAVDLKGVSILSGGGALNPATWIPVTDNYDDPPPGNGSVDPDDTWTILTETAHELSEEEPTGDGGTLGIGQSVNLGNAWTKSTIEDLVATATLVDDQVLPLSISFVDGPDGGSFVRGDLNTDGSLTAADWLDFYPNMLADLGSMTDVERALAGDLNGDGDVDVVDFALFKSDYEAVFGAGSFDAMTAQVPEPSTYAMLLVAAIGGCMIRLRRRFETGVMALAMIGFATWAGPASAAPVDFTTFTVEHFPEVDPGNFPLALWDTTPSTATLNFDASPNVFYGAESAMNKRIFGTVTPGSDDDVVGFVLGFDPGDAQFGSMADYMLVDWKGANQTFNFEDANLFDFFHSATPGGLMPAGLALSRVTGRPTADELWQHADLPENAEGGVTQLARGATLDTTPYNRAGGSHFFDITYTATNIKVSVDGVLQFDMDGSFPDGRFGLYTLCLGPAPIFSNFEIQDAGFEGLSATVDRGDGTITLNNDGTAPVEFDFYQFDSLSNSLDEEAWNSLSEQDHQSVGAGDHQRWQEAGGSDPSNIAEVFLASNSTLAGGTSLSIGGAYNNLVNGEDLVLQYRLPSGFILEGDVQYIGTAPGGLTGDYNGDGAVNAADYTVWRDNLGGTATIPNDSTPGTVTPADYTVWRANFGNPGSGSGSAVVPEPTSLALLSCVALLLGVRRSSRRNA